MNEYKLSPKALVMVAGSSKGTQNKYYDNGYWYKVNSKGYEGLSEYLVSQFLSCTDVDNYVAYEKCTINGKAGCRSYNFLEPGENFISFQRLYDIYHGDNLSEAIILLDNPKERIHYTIDFIKEAINFDASEYLSKILTLDMIMLNTDRHFNNLGVIINTEKGVCKEAPIFDNGAALFSDFATFNPENSFDENLARAFALPFSSNFEFQAKECGLYNFAIDYDRLNFILEKEPDSRAVEVLKIQIERYKSLFLDMNLDLEEELEEDCEDDFDIADE